MRREAGTVWSNGEFEIVRQCRVCLGPPGLEPIWRGRDRERCIHDIGGVGHSEPRRRRAQDARIDPHADPLRPRAGHRARQPRFGERRRDMPLDGNADFGMSPF